MNRSPVTLLIDDPSPCINPLYYFASQVPKNAIDYHYTKKEGKWYFDSDLQFKFPIVDSIERGFVHEFADWVSSINVLGKISVVPFPAGLGRIDRKLDGFPKNRVSDFVSTFKDEISKKFDIGPEMLTHTRALNLKTKKLTNGISEHDWSQKQNTETLSKYLRLALEIVKSAGLEPTGVTSPCNFGMYVEDEYARAVLDAGKTVLGLKVLWYFLHVDSKSQNVDHKIMYLDREAGEAVVSLVGGLNDPLWSGQFTDLSYDDWVREKIDPILSPDGTSGRIFELVKSTSYVTIVTHWQSLYSSGSRYGLKGLGELVSRINERLGDRILWMKCTEIANYLAFSSSVSFQTRRVRDSEKNEDSTVIELTSPFVCRDFTFSFEEDSAPREIFLNSEEDSGQQEKEKLERVSKPPELRSNSWASINGDGSVKTFVCIGELLQKKEKTIDYGVTKKTSRKLAKVEYQRGLVVVW